LPLAISLSRQILEFSVTDQGSITLPLFKGAVKTPSGLKPAWYVILDAGNQAEAERLGVNFSKKLPTPAMLHAPPHVAPTGRFSSSRRRGLQSDRVVVPGSEDQPFPPKTAQPGSVGDADYSPLVRVDGIVTTRRSSLPRWKTPISTSQVESRTTLSCMIR